MAIKFRCLHCRQFLGISRSMAGQLVDCPTCGRRLRVPRPDKHAQTLSQPRLNLQDAGLTNALNELATIGSGSVETIVPPADSSPSSQSPGPAPVPEPIPIDPPLPAEPVTSRASECDVATSELHIPQSEFRTPNVSAGRRDWRSLFPLPVILSLCVAVVTAFLLGYVIGRSRPATATWQRSADKRSLADNSPQGARSLKASAPSLKGRITYKTDSGLSRPDRGARILVFPKPQEGANKLSVAGFRPDDAAADFEAAAAELRTLGGNAAVADGDGNFALSLSQAGRYDVLVLSHYQQRDDEQPLEPELTTLLESYFERPGAILGQFAYYFGQIRYKGEGTEVWDHSFEKS